MAKGKKGEGEKAIELILKKYKIKYSTKKKIKLSKDSKKYRIPDFYLPEHNLAIEYFSSWNFPKNKKFEKNERARFMEKVGAYQSSGVHCVYIYPNEINYAEQIILKSINKTDSTKKESKEPLLWVIPWLDEAKIEEPLPEDFLEKPSDWKELWPEEKPIEKKEIEIQTNEIPIKTITTISERKYTLPEEAPKHKVLVGNPFILKKEKTEYSSLGIIILGLAAIILLIFLGYLVSFLSPELYEMNESIFYGFVLLAGLLILLSAFYSIKKNIFTGFVSVGAILLLISLVAILLLGDDMVKIVLTIIIVVAILPTIYYMITYNEK